MTDDDIFDGVEVEVTPCPVCDGDALPIGALGSRVHFRCRNCGWTFSLDDSSISTGKGLS